MSPQYLIRRVDTCKYCEGKGHYPDPEWQRLIERYRAHFDEHGDPDDDAWEALIKEFWPHQEPPPEDAWCVDCEGEGKTETWLDLRQALDEIEHERKEYAAPS